MKRSVIEQFAAYCDRYSNTRSMDRRVFCHPFFSRSAQLLEDERLYSARYVYY